MNIGLHTGARNPEQLIEQCNRLGVNHLCLSCSSIPGYDEQGHLDAESLMRFKKTLDNAGIHLDVMMPQLPSEDALLGKPEGQKEGETDTPKVLRLLQEVDYDGVICPEHLGAAKEGEDLMAKSVEYLRERMV